MSLKNTLDVSQIVPRLWLGAAPDNVDISRGRQQAAELAAMGIGLVVDCRAGADDENLWQRFGVRYLNIGVEDQGLPLPPVFFTEGTEAIFTHWAFDDNSVFVHCEFGVARSPALVLAVLLVEGYSEDEATALIRAKRPAISPRYFEDALCWYAWFTAANS